MARNTATQNPSNKVGRYSGAGSAGISELVPTEREAARGLRPISVSGGGWGRVGIGVGILGALVGAGITAYLLQQRAERERGLRPRLERLVGLR